MARLASMVLVLLAPACHAWQFSTGSTRRYELQQVSGRAALPVLWPRPAARCEVSLDAASTNGGGASELTPAKGSPPEADGAAEPAVVVDVVVDVAAQQALDVIVQEELAVLAGQTPEEQETQLPTLLARVEARAADASEAKGYRFGDISRAVVESTRGEVRRQMDTDWNMDDISLLLKVGLFLGAGAAAPAAGLAAMPAALVLATYGTVLKAELGVRAIQEVGVRLAERAAQGVVDGVKTYTGKESYKFGDLTEATVNKVTGKDDYTFGDVTKGALKSVTGKDDYKFGDISKGALKSVTGKDEYKFGDLSKSLFRKLKGGGEEKKPKDQAPGGGSE